MTSLWRFSFIQFYGTSRCLKRQLDLVEVLEAKWQYHQHKWTFTSGIFGYKYKNSDPFSDIKYSTYHCCSIKLVKWSFCLFFSFWCSSTLAERERPRITFGTWCAWEWAVQNSYELKKVVGIRQKTLHHWWILELILLSKLELMRARDAHRLQWVHRIIFTSISSPKFLERNKLFY